ncbi:MAG: FN3 associated domain-containing protein, partial [Candidatus Acidiferrales bacterium]
ATTTVKAMTVASGFANSGVASATYTLQGTAATPVITPGTETFTGTVSVTMSDSTAGSTIYYTTNGNNPVVGASGTSAYAAGITVSATTTVKAMAVASGFANSGVTSATYTLQGTAATPVITPGTETFTGTVSVTMSDSTAGSTIYYTTNGNNPVVGASGTTAYSAGITVSATTTVKAMAVASGFANSGLASATYTLQSGGSTTPISFGSGFTSSAGFQLNGNAAWNQSASALRLTDTTTTAEAGSVFYTTPVNIQAFTTNFTFQLTNANADGFTFTIQNNAPTALGPSGGGLGYGAASAGGTGGIPKSVAVKFDLYSNEGEGTDSVGTYVNGASPTIPATDMTATGVILNSGDVLNATVTYDGTALILTVSDATKGTSFTQSWDINITSAVGGSTAYVGFTGGTGGETATQQILTWSYTTGNPNTKDPVIFETDALVGQSVSSGPTYQEFSCTCFENGLGSQLLATKVGDNVTIPVTVATAGTYDVKVAVKRLSIRGIMQASLNGVNFGPAVDQYDAVTLWQEYDLGTVALAAGSQPIKFTVTGTDPASGSYQITFDYIKLTPQ